MFRRFNEYSIEVDVPICKVWDFYFTPSNWPKWIDQFEDCSFEDDLKKGSIIKAKIRNKKLHFPILIKKVVLHHRFDFSIKGLLASQESSLILKKKSSDKTLITIKTSLKSVFTLFCM